MQREYIMVLEVVDLGMNFEGVAKHEGKVYFVPYSLPGEKVEIDVAEDKKNFVLARLKEVKEQTNERTTPFCPYFFECGGCDIQHMVYDTQLRYKAKLVKDTIKKVAGIDVCIRPTIESDKTYFYRNKGAFPVGKEVGMFAQNSHKIVPIKQCMLMDEGIATAYKIVAEYLKNNNLLGYDHNRHFGAVKNIVIRSIDNQTLVCLVVTKQLILKDLYDKLSEKLDRVGLYQNINRQNNSTILGKEYVFVDGIKSIKLNEFGVEYELGIASFLQVNTGIKTKIYQQVIDELDDVVVIDAYAGAGLLSSIIAKKAKMVYSVELVKQASQSAEKLKKDNQITNMQVINGDCGKVVPNIAKDIKEPFAIVLDPARVGCSQEVIQASKVADKILYISCNPIALSKDLKLLAETHKIKYIQPYDMFPQTKHVETLVCLEKIKE